MAAAKPGFDPGKPSSTHELKSNYLQLLMSWIYKPKPPSMSELKVVLLGGNWSERRSVGNFILGCDAFTTSSNTFNQISAELQEKQISVINSPDLSFHTTEKLTDFIRKCSEASDPGPHVFLLVVQPDSFTEGAKDKIFRILQGFSDRSFDHSLVLILKSRQKGSVINSPLKDLIIKCRNGYLKMEETEREQLLIRFGQIEKENNGEHVRFEDLTNTSSTGSFGAVDQTNVTSPLKRSHSSELIPPSLSELRVVLLGGSWSQRNTVRKLILGGKHFTTQPNSFIKITGSVEDSKLSVINTPDLQFPSANSLTEFIRDCALASDPGPHVFLLVLQPESFTEEEKNRIYKVLYHFNDESFNHSLIMILNPRQEGSDLMEKHMKNPPLKELIRECRYRYLFQMMVEPSELLTRFKQIVKENNGEHVSFDEFVEESSGVSVYDGEVKDRFRTTELIPQQLPKDDKSFRIVLLGVGDNEEKKTELVNQVIPNPELFIQNPPSQCVAYCGKWGGKPVTMVTFPHLSSLTENKRAEVKSCRNLCHPGPNVLLLIVNPSKFYEDQRDDLDSILELFSQDALKHSVVINAHNIKLTRPLTEKLITDCEGRYYEMFTAHHGDHEKLMEKVGEIVKKNKNTSDLLGAKGKSVSEDTPVYHHAECLRMVLIGKTGSGKSSSGNTILGRKEFKSESSPQSVTRTCQKADSEVDGRHVVVVDTPGLFDNNLTSDQVNEELKSCISLVAPGPHVFLLVLPIGRFTTGEDTETLRLIEEVLGHNYKRFTVVLFTRGDTLEHEETSIEDYTKTECDEACRDLIRDCGGRIHVFNNNEQNNRSQVTELIKMIDIMVRKNKGSSYTREMLCGVNI